MNTAHTTINLARRLRPQQFSQIIGQDIPVRMLKNSLYLNKFFPVYLFAGQRGCGKTSTARVFAAAANCEALTTFQQNPTQADIPCLTCFSCLAMKRGAHPDFIEIDAASNTGVDNVRQLIETAAYIPLQGQKKIYLIDEAHMLSKAAFNALLKILEEPPISVLFMLATTELHKIPQTVLSRCFQLSFPALERQALTTYLKEVCQHEEIAIDDAALAVLIEETDGSARDALNLIEQLRFVESPISEVSIRKILGKLSITILLDLLGAVITNDPTAVLTILQTNALQAANPQATWNLLINAVKTLLWSKYSNTVTIGEFAQYQSRCTELAQACSHNRLLAIMQLLWEQEHIFLQTSKKTAFLEFLFLQLAEQDNIASIDELVKNFTTDKKSNESTSTTHKFTPQTLTPIKAISSQPLAKQPVLEKKDTLIPQTLTVDLKEVAIGTEQAIDSLWQSFLTKLRTASTDTFLVAILEQAAYTPSTTGEMTLLLKQHSKFFTEKLDDMKTTWLPVLQEVFGTLKKVQFDQMPESKVKSVPLIKVTAQDQAPTDNPRQRPIQPITKQNTNPYKTFKPATNSVSNSFEGEFIAPSTDLPFASLLVTHFPGKLKQLKKSAQSNLTVK